MCGRFVVQILPYEFLQHFGVEPPAYYSPRYNVAPTQVVATLRLTANGRREVVMMRWGLVPSWTTDLKKLPSLFNARSESVSQLGETSSIPMRVGGIQGLGRVLEYSKTNRDYWAVLDTLSAFVRDRAKRSKTESIPVSQILAPKTMCRLRWTFSPGGNK